MEVSVAGRRAESRAIGVMEPRADYSLFFTHSNDGINRASPFGKAQIKGGIDKAATRLVLLLAQGGEVLLVHGRPPCQFFGLGGSGFERSVLQVCGAGRAALFVNPDCD